jgi:hypothetical protein
MGHFGVKKTDDVLAAHFFWPRMRRDVERFMARCTTCQKAKSRLNPHGLYMPLPVLSVRLCRKDTGTTQRTQRYRT